VAPGKKAGKLDADVVVAGELLEVEVVGRMYDAVRSSEENCIAVAAVVEVVDVVAVELGMTALVEGSYAVAEEEGRQRHELESFAAGADTSIVIVGEKSREEEHNAVVVLVALAGQSLEVLETMSGKLSGYVLGALTRVLVCHSCVSEACLLYIFESRV
jgi:hypothetical protein